MEDNRMTVRVTPATEAIIDVLEDGRATPGYLRDETGLARNTVHSQLNALLAGECIRYVHEPTGLYELVEDPRDE